MSNNDKYIGQLKQALIDNLEGITTSDKAQTVKQLHWILQNNGFVFNVDESKARHDIQLALIALERKKLVKVFVDKQMRQKWFT